MTNDEQLQNPENWDFERAEVREGVRRSRAVVSVAFSGDDFDLVTCAAERAGLKLSAFIREAAVSQAKTIVSGGSIAFFDEHPTVTVARWGFIPSVSEDISSLAKAPA